MKLKKIGVSFLVAIISFLCISNNVSALTSYDFTTAYEYKADLAYVWLENGEYKSEIVDESVINRIKNYMDSRGKYYMILLKNNFSSSNPNPYYDQYYTYIQVIEYLDSTTLPTIILSYNGALITSTFNSFDIRANHDSYDSSVSSIDNYISQLENISISDRISPGQDSYLVYPNWVTSDIPPNRNGATAIYYANFDLIYHNDSDSDIVIGDYTISAGDEFITLSDYKQLTEEENDDVHVFPNIEPLEGYDRYAVISTKCVYNNGHVCVSISEEPNYYLLYFNQNFTYGVFDSTTLWPDNVNLVDNFRLYNILNNEWNDFWRHDSTFFPFPEPLDLYDTKVVYSNFDIYYYDSDEIYFKSSIEQELEVEVPTTTDYVTTFDNKDFMLLIQNDFCQYANEENYIDYKVKISAKNAFNSDSSRTIYFQSMYADNNKFGKFIDDSINSMTGNSSIVFIDENTLEVNIRLSINDVEFACNTMPTSRLFKFDLGQLIDELKTENFEIEIYSSAKGNKYTILPYEFYEKDIYFTSKALYDSSVLFYLDPTNVTETTDNTIYLKNNVDYGVWNYQNSTSKRDKYFDLSMKYGLYTYKIEFDTENNKITGFNTIDDNLIFLDSAYTLKVHHPQSDFIIGDLIIQDNTEEVEIIKDSYENINDLLDTFNNYLTQIKKPIAPIMGLVGDLFNSMNSHIKGALISLLIILLLCALIKQIFKS